MVVGFEEVAHSDLWSLASCYTLPSWSRLVPPHARGRGDESAVRQALGPCETRGRRLQGEATGRGSPARRAARHERVCTTPRKRRRKTGIRGSPVRQAHAPFPARGAEPLRPPLKRKRRAKRAELRRRLQGGRVAAAGKRRRAASGAQRHAERQARRSVSIATPKAGRGTERVRSPLSFISPLSCARDRSPAGPRREARLARARSRRDARLTREEGEKATPVLSGKIIRTLAEKQARLISAANDAPVRQEWTRLDTGNSGILTSEIQLTKGAIIWK